MPVDECKNTLDPGLVLAVADFAIKYGKGAFKHNWGDFRKYCIDDLSPHYAGSRDILMSFLSKKENFDLMKKLTGGSESSYLNFLNAFKEECKGTNHNFEPESLIEKIKQEIELGEADTSFEKIVINYLQKASEHNGELKQILYVVSEIYSKLEHLENEKKKYEEKFSSGTEIYSSYVKELLSDLDPAPKIKFNIFFKKSDGEIQPIVKLEELIQSKRRVLLKGSAGTGKTIVVSELVSKLVEKKKLPVVIELDWHEFSERMRINEKNDVESKLEDMLHSSSIGTVNINHLKNFEGEIWIIFDGLNEIAAGEYGEENVRQMLRILEDYSRNESLKIYILVTDRLYPRGFAKKWEIVTIEPLLDEDVAKQIDSHFGDGKYASLSNANRLLLSKPFFLNIALSSNSVTFASESLVFYRYFINQLKISEDDLERLSKLAFDFYAKYKSPFFDYVEFEKLIGKAMCEKLVSAGTVSKTGDKNLEFVHQLLHDYLASFHLAHDQEKWNIESFDIVTLESNIEPIFLTLQQITEIENADRFLLAVYDWNWRFAISSMIMASKLGIAKHSDELSTAMLAVLAQKRFDRMQKTSSSANNELLGYDLPMAKQFAETKDLKSLLQLINNIEPKTEGFYKWKELFTMDRDSNNIGESVINLILSNNSLVGWTASNVLRECNLDKLNQLQLRTILQSSDSNNHVQNTRRWRVIHPLGKFPSEESADLLLHTIENDTYEWAKYGAARALIEMAAVTDNASLREHILMNLKKLLPTVKINVLEEIGRAVFYKDAYGSWDKEVIDLLEKIKNSEKDEDKKIWDDKIKEYREGAWKN